MSNTESFGQKLHDAKKLLNRFGIDTSKMDEDDVFAKMEKIQNYKKANVQVLSRGQVLDGFTRLLKYVPEGMRGEFKRNDSMAIDRARAMGWEVFVNEEAKKESLTGSADGRVRLGDSILMVMPEEMYIALHLEKDERAKRRRQVHAQAFKGKNVVQGDGNAGADPLSPVFDLETVES